MSTNEKAIETLEKAAARIGCPPGDNADADLYRDIMSTLSALRSQEEPVAWIARATFKSGEKIDLLAATEDVAMGIAKERFRSALFPPTIATIPLYSHPAHSVGSLSDAEIERIATRYATEGIGYEIPHWTRNVLHQMKWLRDHGYLSTDGSLREVGRSSGEGSSSDDHAPTSTPSPDNTTER